MMQTPFVRPLANGYQQAMQSHSQYHIRSIRSQVQPEEYCSPRPVYAAKSLNQDQCENFATERLRTGGCGNVKQILRVSCSQQGQQKANQNQWQGQGQGVGRGEVGLGHGQRDGVGDGEGRRLPVRRRRQLCIDVEPQMNEDFDCSRFSSLNLNDGWLIDGSGLQVQQEYYFKLSPSDITLQEVIGKGSSSIVHKGVRNADGTLLALKTIRNVFDEKVVEQVMKEVRSLTLSHTKCPAIVNFYGAYFDEGCVTIALEYMDGGSLDNVLRQLYNIPEHGLAGIFYQAVYGLEFLRRCRRVHRDIKPSNILINSKGEVKLTDFGVCKDVTLTLGHCNTFIGTFKYMSPERLNGGEYCFAADIWALGIVCIECATGMYPYGRNKIKNETDSFGRKNSNLGFVRYDNIEEVMENPSPLLPPKATSKYEGEVCFSKEVMEFVAECVAADPQQRALPCDLLQHKWMQKFHLFDVTSAVMLTKSWIDE